MSQQHFDIVIVGGGLIGVSLLSALRDLPLKVAIVEPTSVEVRRQETFDSKAIALTPTSKQIFQGLGSWNTIAEQALPIHRIHVSDQGRFGSTVFDRSDNQDKPLGYVISLHLLHDAIQATLNSEKITWFCPAKVVSVSATVPAQLQLSTGECISANLLIGADGANSFIRQAYGILAREYDFQQTAIVANIGLQRDHQRCAYERFTPKGPMAMLPLSEQRSALIWSLPPAMAMQMMSHSSSAFLSEVQRVFGYRLGRLKTIGKRFMFPLNSVFSTEIFRPGMVLIGNASHALHPIAGQGFNLGLRDVALLVDSIRSHYQKKSFGTLAMLQSYASNRHTDVGLTQLFCDWVPRIFANHHPVMTSSRGLGMVLIDHLPQIKKLFLNQNMGLHAHPSELSCGIVSMGGSDES